MVGIKLIFLALMQLLLIHRSVSEDVTASVLVINLGKMERSKLDKLLPHQCFANWTQIASTLMLFQQECN